MGIAERKRREFENREQVILGAALSLFDCDEWLSVTVEQIAERAEVGKGTVYKHFPSKEAIYARLSLDFYYGLLEELAGLDINRGAIPVLSDIFSTSLQYHARQPEFRRVTQYCKRIDFKERASFEFREAFDRLDASFRNLIDELISRGIEGNEIPEESATHIYYCMRACFDGSIDTVSTGYLGMEQIDVDEYISVLTKFVIAGVTGLGKVRNGTSVKVKLS